MIPPPFNLDALRERMSEGSFANGLDLAQDGAVTLVAVEDEVATAHVQGGELYVVELRPPADGTCTCPGFDKFGACKHQVAAAAAVKALDAAGLQTVQARIARLRDGPRRSRRPDRTPDRSGPAAARGAGGAGRRIAGPANARTLPGSPSA
jgi:uncharacterized Zn finger protein